MFRKLYACSKVTITVAAVALTAILMAGCGNNQADTSAPAPAPAPEAKSAASGPAISTKLKFSQLALDSPVKRVTNKEGLVYFYFKYTDKDNNVYNCELPEAMSEGEYTADEWLATFAQYKLPQVVKHKAVKKSKTKGLNDFPFISPKSESAHTQK